MNFKPIYGPILILIFVVISFTILIRQQLAFDAQTKKCHAAGGIEVSQNNQDRVCVKVERIKI